MFHRSLLLLALSGLASSAFAQTFEPAVDISTGVNGSFGVATGDLDGDGLEDIVSVGRIADAVYWQKNLGDGSFSGLNTVATSMNDVRNAVCADIDGDGDLDIAVSVFGSSDGHVWFSNDGGGLFSAPVSIISGGGAIDLLAADLDGDGDMDVAGVNLLTDQVRVAWNDGSGSFTDTLLSTTQNGPRGLDLADINADGTLDLVVASRYDNEVAWYPNNGDGSFAAKQAVGTVNEAFSISCADLDGDGTQDVVSAGNVANQVVWWPNVADTFSVRLIAANGISEAVDAITGDFDLDGDVDVITVERGGSRLELHTNDGSGSFMLAQILTTSASGAIDAKTADLDNDGDLDVVVASEFDDAVTVIINSTIAPVVCPAPTMPMASPTSNSAVVSWTGDPDHIGYLVQGRVAGSTSFRNGLAMDTFRNTGVLFPGVTYEWKVTARCSDGTNSESTALQSFTTLTLKAGVAANPLLARSGESRFQLSGLPTGSQVRVVDMAGRLVHSFQSTASVEALDASAWASGLYLVEWHSPEGENGTFKLVRE